MAVDLTAPEGVRAALRRGLRLHEAGRSGDGLKPETVAWARRMAEGDAASEQKIREMSAWHKRHAASKSPGWDEPGKEKPGFVAYLLWGGEPGEAWADRKVAELDRAERASTPAAFTRATMRKVNPESLIRGEPLVVLRPGVVRDYDGQELDGNVTDAAQLHEMVAYFEKVQRPSGELPLIDFNHMAVGGLSFLASPEAALPMGAVLEMRVIEDDAGHGLEVVPGWTKRGRRYVDDAEGLLYPSATYRLSPTGDRMNPEPKAGAALLAFAITPTPATRADQLGAIRAYDSAGVVPPARLPADTDAPPAVVPAHDEEAPKMGMNEILAAIDGLPPEEMAALKAKLGAGDKPAAEPERMADAPPTGPERMADPVAEARGLAAAAFADGLVSARAIKPAERAVWVRAYLADPAATKAAAPAPASAVNAPVGDAARPTVSAEPPTERNAFAAFARNLGGGDLVKGLDMAKTKHPAAFNLAFSQAPAARKGGAR
jgi:hypothetical protein